MEAATGDALPARGRFVAGLHAVRRWAAAHPHEHALLYGTPVPGYAAPATTIVPASRLYAALLRPLVGARPSGAAPVPASLDAELAGMAVALDLDLAPETAMAATGAWATLIGAISLELFGHLTSTIEDRETWFGAIADQIADRFAFPADGQV